MTLMTKPTPSALFDLTGAFISPGTVRKRWEFNPTTEAAVPPWIVKTTPTADFITLSPTNETPRGVRITAATANSSGVVRGTLGDPVERSTKLAASSIRFAGVDSVGAAASNTISLRISTTDDDTGRGAALISQGTTFESDPLSPTAQRTITRAFYNGTVLTQRSLHRYPDNFNRVYQGADLGLYVDWRMGMVYALEGEDVVSICPAPGLLRSEDDQPVQARFAVTAPSGATLRVASITVDHWYY